MDAPFPDSLDCLRLREFKLGGTGGATFLVDPLSGSNYVLKYTRVRARPAGAEMSHAAMEFVANRVYSLLGVRVPDVALYDAASRRRVESGSAAVFSSDSLILLVRHVAGLESIEAHLQIPRREGGRSLQLDDPAWVQRVEDPTVGGDSLAPRVQSLRSAAAAGFVADCLLANWDVCGWVFDNLCVDKQGLLWRLDQGGCCIYRAKGALKSANEFGGAVFELANLRRGDRNPNGRFLFEGITKSEVLRQIAFVQAHRQEILALFRPWSALRRVMESRLNHLSSDAWESSYE